MYAACSLSHAVKWPAAMSLFLLVGCSTADSDPSGSAQVPTSTHFYSAFVAIDSVTLRQPDDAQVVTFIGGLIDKSGRILIVDGSEGDLSLYEKDGNYNRQIVAKGEGPDQIVQPPVILLDMEGRLHAGAMGRRDVLVFGGPDYDLIRRVSLDSARGIVSLARLDNGDYVSTESTALGRHSVMRHDSLGRFVAGYMTRTYAPVADQPDDPLWNMFLSPSIRVKGDTALVIQTLADSVWRVELSTGEVSSDRISFEGYVAPSFPEIEQRRNLNALREWVGGFHLAVQFAPGRGAMDIVQYVRGGLFAGENVTLRMVSENAVYTGAPPIFSLDPEGVVVVRAAELSEGVIRLVRYRFVDP